MAIEAAPRKTSPNALIIHGWNDNPNQGWLGWLADEMRTMGYVVDAPHLKVDERPLLKRWSEQVHPLIEHLDGAGVIVAHSLGCFTALRQLEVRNLSAPIGKVILVSGFYDAPNESASKFFSPEPNWQAIRTQAAHFICLASDDDTIVTPDRSRRLAHKLGAKFVTVSGKGHFLGSRGMDTLPEILEFID